MPNYCEEARVCKLVAVLAAVALYQATITQCSNLTISTSPRGPVYAAASWVRLACRQDHASPETLQYSWRGSCRGSGHTVYDIAQPLLDEESWAVIWLKTTSVECLDHFRCTVYETEGETLTEIASEDFVLDHVSGVGVSLPDDVFLGSVPNNSAVIYHRESERPQKLLCHSALQSSCTGQWLGLGDTASHSCEGDGMEEGEEEEEGGSGERGGSGAGVSFGSVGLDLGMVAEDGVYVCSIQDEDRQEQKLYVGLYQSVPELEVEPGYEVTNRSLVLDCHTQGLPVTAALFSKDGVLLSGREEGLVSSSFPLTQVGGGSHREAAYENSLSLTDPSMTGLFSCNIHSDWVMADKTESGRKSATAFFVVSQLLEEVTLECVFPEGITDVHWTNDSGLFEFLPAERNNTAVISLLATEAVHGHIFRCSGRTQRGQAVHKLYRVVVRVPHDALTVRVVPPDGEPMLGEATELACCANVMGSGLTSPPFLQWHRHGRGDGHLPAQGAELNVSDGASERCLTVRFESLSSEELGEYVCTAALQSPDMQDMLVMEREFVLSAAAPASEPGDRSESFELSRDESGRRSKSNTDGVDSSRSSSNARKSQLMTAISSAIFSLVVCVVLLATGATLLALCLRRSRKRGNTHTPAPAMAAAAAGADAVVLMDTQESNIDHKEEKINI